MDEVRSFRCTVGSGQDGGQTTGDDGLTMSCIDRILEGHNHDLIVLKRVGVNYSTGCFQKNPPQKELDMF